MSRMLPKFPRMQNGDLRMGDSKEAAQGTFQGFSGICQPPEIIQKKAKEEVRRQGDPSNKQHVLGQNIMQFGRYRGQSFKWMLENCLGYAGWLCYFVTLIGLLLTVYRDLSD
ncbi:hypothetical protein FSP39_001157 [Pinctada imbricata]|uniref:Uncharacterized protein n=1 Tax=Pinctada imbricata TaxID=66713 RepID=A0AA89C3Y5_PINIB|nr:hypothetical protein FSP39_001157 [Pinctada imbricata]